MIDTERAFIVVLSLGLRIERLLDFISLIELFKLNRSTILFERYIYAFGNETNELKRLKTDLLSLFLVIKQNSFVYKNYSNILFK